MVPRGGPMFAVKSRTLGGHIAKHSHPTWSRSVEPAPPLARVAAALTSSHAQVLHVMTEIVVGLDTYNAQSEPVRAAPSWRLRSARACEPTATCARSDPRADAPAVLPPCCTYWLSPVVRGPCPHQAGCTRPLSVLCLAPRAWCAPLELTSLACAHSPACMALVPSLPAADVCQDQHGNDGRLVRLRRPRHGLGAGETPLRLRPPARL